ncbi:MAG: hypothetical protein HQL36_10115 [Alphaproteobacteria bacterium]|nr:hypothetical protein [Alphaproteobacteria bacterium]
MRSGKSDTGAHFGAQDRDLMVYLSGQASLDRWFQVWEKINTLVARTDGLNLDRKQVVIDAFLSLENTVRHAR